MFSLIAERLPARVVSLLLTLMFLVLAVLEDERDYNMYSLFKKVGDCDGGCVASPSVLVRCATLRTDRLLHNKFNFMFKPLRDLEDCGE